MGVAYFDIIYKDEYDRNSGERRDLNSRPLAPQTLALPLSYSHPITRILYINSWKIVLLFIVSVIIDGNTPSK